MFKRLCLGLNGEEVGHTLGLAFDGHHVLLIDIVAGEIHLAGDVPAVHAPGALPGDHFPQLLVDGAQCLAGQQLPFAQESVDGAHCIGGGELI